MVPLRFRFQTSRICNPVGTGRTVSSKSCGPRSNQKTTSWFYQRSLQSQPGLRLYFCFRFSSFGFLGFLGKWESPSPPNHPVSNPPQPPQPPHPPIHQSKAPIGGKLKSCLPPLLLASAWNFVPRHGHSQPGSPEFVRRLAFWSWHPEAPLEKGEFTRKGWGLEPIFCWQIEGPGAHVGSWRGKPKGNGLFLGGEVHGKPTGKPPFGGGRGGGWFPN